MKLLCDLLPVILGRFDMCRNAWTRLCTSAGCYALTALVCTTAVGFCQDSYWIQVYPSTSPAARGVAKMVYDAARREVVLFGGCVAPDSSVPCVDSDETWVWNGRDWIEKSPANRPPARHTHAMAYDSVRQEVVLFGGVSINGVNPQHFNDTWVWDGSNWHQRTPAHSPSPREMHAVAFDEARGKMVLFGGVPPIWVGGETWLWDGSDWTQVSPATPPPLRWQFSMVYDSRRDRVVLFGGWGGSSGLSDTWSWDGSNWHEEVTSTAPSARWGHAMAYDPVRGEGVMFAGLNPPSFAADTWVWDGTDWRQKVSAVSPAWRVNHTMTYDAAHGQILLFGGDQNNGMGPFRFLNDTWVLGAPIPTDFFLHGSGGTANPPGLFLDSLRPGSTTAKYRDSAGIKFGGGNLWAEAGAWTADPALTRGTLSSLNDLHGWVGLKNSDDQGTRFDLRAEVLKNGTLVASGETYCIEGVTRNPDLAKEAIVVFSPFSPAAFNGTTDVLSLRTLTRIGTNGSGNFCGGHSNAVGLRLYFDALSRPSRFGSTF